MRLLVTGLTLTALAAGGLSATAEPAAARDCGQLKLAGRTYNLDVRDLSCAKGKRLAKRHIAFNEAPRGYNCTRSSDDHEGKCRKPTSSKVVVRVFSWDIAAQAG